MLGMIQNVANPGAEEVDVESVHGVSLEGHAKSCLVICARLDEAKEIIATTKALGGQSPNWVGIITPDDAAPGADHAGIPTYAGLNSLAHLVGLQHQKGFDLVTVVVGETAQPLPPDDAAYLARGEPKHGYLVIRLSSLWRSSSGEPETLRVLSPHHYAVKRWLEVGLVIVIGLFLLPVIGLIALGNFLSSPQESIFFRQWRPGLMGKPFLLCKFRSFKKAGHRGAAGVSGVTGRTTPWGNFLRRWRLDELPQLWNVFVGDMALIGPRPLLIEDQPQTHDRLRVRPGLTGWAQINGGHMLSIAQKNALDLFYVRRVSLFFDLKILALTAWRLFKGDQINEDALQQAQREDISA